MLMSAPGEDFDQVSMLSEYIIMELLGEGGFGKVMLGKHRTTGEKVAIKTIDLRKFSKLAPAYFICTARAYYLLFDDHKSPDCKYRERS